MFFSTTNQIMTFTKLPLNIEECTKIGIKGEWFVSKKESGVRAIWTGKNFLDKKLVPIPNVPESFTKDFPIDFCFDGILKGISFDFKKPTDWNNVEYLVFDYPKQGIPFYIRLDILKKKEIFKINQKVKLIDFILIEHIQDKFNKVNDEFKKAIKSGYLGVMLINADSFYEGKKSSNLLEYTKGTEGKGKIISFHEGIKTTYGFLGKYKCITTNGKYFYVSKNIPMEIRKKYNFVKTKCVFVDPTAPQIGDTLFFESDKMVTDTIPKDPFFIKTEKAIYTTPKTKQRGKGEMRARRRGRKMALKRNHNKSRIK